MTANGPRIAVVDYGIGNLRSAEKALQHLGADAALTSDAGAIERADAVVLPGVGAFGACMKALRAAGLEAVTRTAATDGRPFLGICIGMQMLFDGSDETPDVAGLGVVAGRVTLLPKTRAPAADGVEHARGRERRAAGGRSPGSGVAVLRALVRARARRRGCRRGLVRVRPSVRGR